MKDIRIKMKEKKISSKTFKLALKKEECVFSENNVPTQSLLQKWLRSKGVEIIVGICPESDYREYEFSVVDLNGDEMFWINSLSNNDDEIQLQMFKSYENALENALQIGLRLIKNKNK